MKERPILFSGAMVRAILAGTKTQTRRIERDGDTIAKLPYPNVCCPYGALGDRLWVRETWRSWRSTCAEDDADDEHECGPHCDQTYVAYQATPRDGYRPKPDHARITYLDESTPLERNQRLLGPWKPSIHMPRAFSRIDLEVVSVRVERLQDITEEDARAEGVPLVMPIGCNSSEYRASFRALWAAINGDRAPWASNPWVWRVEFRRARP